MQRLEVSCAVRRVCVCVCVCVSLGAKELIQHGCTNPGDHVTRATKFCTMAPNICGSSIRNLLHVTLVTLRILRQPPDFWKVCEPLPKRNHTCGCTVTTGFIPCHVTSRLNTQTISDSPSVLAVL